MYGRLRNTDFSLVHIVAPNKIRDFITKKRKNTGNLMFWHVSISLSQMFEYRLGWGWEDEYNTEHISLRNLQFI